MKAVMITLLFLMAANSVPGNASPDNEESFVFKRQQKRIPGKMQGGLFTKDTSGQPTPRVLLLKDRIEIRDKDGNVKDTIAKSGNSSKNIETRFYPDKHGKVVGVHVTQGYSQSHESWTSGEYYILDVNGSKTLDIKNFNDNTRPIPSPSGDYAVGWPEADTPGGPPIFYDADGQRNKWAHGFKGDGWPEMYETWDACFSPDGKHVAVLAKNGDTGKKTLMLVYDAFGNKVFAKESVGNDVLFSPDSAHIAYYSPINHKLGLVSVNGKVDWEADIHALPRLFSDDGKFLLLTTGDSLSMVETATGKMLWKWIANAENLKNRSIPKKSGGWEGFTLRYAAATPNLSRIVVTATTLKDVPVELGKPQLHAVSDKDHLLVFNGQGHLIHWETLPGESFKIPSTLIQISDDGKMVAVSMNDGLEYFSMTGK